MIPGVAGTQTAARRLGLGRALDLCLTGRWIDAQDALLVGMVAEVVPLGRTWIVAHSRSHAHLHASAANVRRYSSWRSGAASICRCDKDSNSNTGSGREEALCEHR